MDERKGFLTEDQEKKIDGLIELSGIYEALDGTAIRMADNIALEKLKQKVLAEKPELLPIIYQIIDEVIAALPEPK